MKINLTLLLSIIVLVSCNEFSQRNLEEQTTITTTASENELLGNLQEINSGEFSLEKLIANNGTFVVTPMVESLQQKIKKFDGNYQQFCQTLEVLDQLSLEQLNAMRAPVQQSWKDFMIDYHRLVLMNYGPGRNATSTAMDSIYSYSVKDKDKCRVDMGIVTYSTRGRLPRFDTIDNYQVRGMDSIEPLIFANPDQSRCSRISGTVKKWFEQPLLKREQDACAYGIHLLGDITLKVEELYRAWSPNHQYFTAQMLGKGKSPIEWANDITEALYSLDTITKDMKLAFPIGLDVMVEGEKVKCGNGSCPEVREHPYAEFSLDALRASVEGFRFMFFGINPVNGVNGMGFDDLLKSRGHADLANQVEKDTLSLLQRLEGLGKQTTMRELLTDIDQDACEETTAEDRKVEACALIADLRKITDFLKVDLLAALAELSAPKQAVGDND